MTGKLPSLKAKASRAPALPAMWRSSVLIATAAASHNGSDCDSNQHDVQLLYQITGHKNGKFHASASEQLHKVQCCSDVHLPGYQRNYNCSIWAEAAVTATVSTAAICAADGGRLCLEEEISRGCTTNYIGSALSSTGTTVQAVRPLETKVSSSSSSCPVKSKQMKRACSSSRRLGVDQCLNCIMSKFSDRCNHEQAVQFCATIDKLHQRKKDPTKHVPNMQELSFHAWVADSKGDVVHDPDKVGGPLEMKKRNKGALHMGRNELLRRGYHYVYEEFEASKSKAVLSWCEAKHPHAGRRFKEIVHEIRTVGPMQDKCYANAFVYVQDSNRTDLHIAIGATRWTKAGGEFLASDMWEFGNPKQWKGVHW